MTRKSPTSEYGAARTRAKRVVSRASTSQERELLWCSSGEPRMTVLVCWIRGFMILRNDGWGYYYYYYYIFLNVSGLSGSIRFKLT